jgi:adhesin/invasin
VNVAAAGQVFSTSGVGAVDSSSYEIYFGARMPAQSGAGVFLNPQGVLNAASFAPPGSPVSPGGFVTLFGSGLAGQTATATAFPFPKILGGVSVTVNGIGAPIYAVSPGQISAIVPYAVTGSTATIIVTSGNTASNAVEVPLAPTAPGVFSLPQNGLGDAAVLHADFSVVNAANPAHAGETVLVFLTGLGAVTPAVADGAPAPATPPLAMANAEVAVTVGGRPCTVVFKGLAPTLAGLYQLNVTLPATLGPGTYSLAVQTVEGFTDMADLRVGL